MARSVTPGKPWQRRPRRPSWAAAPGPSKMGTPRTTPERPAEVCTGGSGCPSPPTYLPRCVSERRGGRRLRFSRRRRRAARLSVHRHAGPGSGHTEGDRRDAPHRPHGGSHRCPPGPQHTAHPPGEGAPGLRARGGASAASAGPGAGPPRGAALPALAAITPAAGGSWRPAAGYRAETRHTGF